MSKGFRKSESLFGDLVELLKLLEGIDSHVGVHDQVVRVEVASIAKDVLEKGGSHDLGDDLHDQAEGKEAEDNVQAGGDEIGAKEGRGALDKVTLGIGAPAGITGVQRVSWQA